MALVLGNRDYLTLSTQAFLVNSVTFSLSLQTWWNALFKTLLTYTLQFNNVMPVEGNYPWFQTFAMSWMLYAFFWVIPRRLNFICQHLGILCLFRLHRRVGMKNSSYLPTYEDGKLCSEMLAYKIQTPRNYPEESIQECYANHNINHQNSFTSL
jgi:hypothetical protein